jgi:hypothetical protein
VIARPPAPGRNAGSAIAALVGDVVSDGERLSGTGRKRDGLVALQEEPAAESGADRADRTVVGAASGASLHAVSGEPARADDQRAALLHEHTTAGAKAAAAAGAQSAAAPVAAAESALTGAVHA